MARRKKEKKKAAQTKAANEYNPKATGKEKRKQKHAINKGFRILFPMKGVMKKRLAKKKIPLATNYIGEIARKFKTHCIQNTPYDKAKDPFFAKNYEFANYDLPVIETEIEQSNFVDAAAGVVKVIVDFFKKMKDKKKRGELSREEAAEIDAIEKAADGKADSDDAESDEDEKGIKDIFTVKNGIMLAIVIGLIFAAKKWL